MVKIKGEGMEKDTRKLLLKLTHIHVKKKVAE